MDRPSAFTSAFTALSRQKAPERAAAGPPQPEPAAARQNQSTMEQAPFSVAQGNVRVISNRLNTQLELPWMAFQRCLYVLFDTGPIVIQKTEGERPPEGHPEPDPKSVVSRTPNVKRVPRPRSPGASAKPNTVDGYEWERYGGQKPIGNQSRELVYYSCTYPGCTAKKRGWIEQGKGEVDFVTTAHNHEKLPPSDAARDHGPQHGMPVPPISSLTFSQQPARKKQSKQSNLQAAKRPERSSKHEPSPQASLVCPVVGVRPASEALAKSTTDALTCPITKKMMTDPVVAGDGFTYERLAIKRWICATQRSPVTEQTLNSLELTPNSEVKRMLEQLQTWPVDDDPTAAVEISMIHPAPIHTAPAHPIVHTAPAHPIVHQAPVHQAPVHHAPVHQAPRFEFDSGAQFGGHGAPQAAMGRLKPISTVNHQSNLHSRHQPIIPTRRPVGEPPFSSKCEADHSRASQYNMPPTLQSMHQAPLMSDRMAPTPPIMNQMNSGILNYENRGIRVQSQPVCDDGNDGAKRGLDRHGSDFMWYNSSQELPTKRPRLVNGSNNQPILRAVESDNRSYAPVLIPGQLIPQFTTSELK